MLQNCGWTCVVHYVTMQQWPRIELRQDDNCILVDNTLTFMYFLNTQCIFLNVACLSLLVINCNVVTFFSRFFDSMQLSNNGHRFFLKHFKQLNYSVISMGIATLSVDEFLQFLQHGDPTSQVSWRYMTSVPSAAAKVFIRGSILLTAVSPVKSAGLVCKIIRALISPSLRSGCYNELRDPKW